MKSICVVVMSLVLSSCATLGTGTKLSEALSYSEVVEVSEVSASDLYTKINLWFVDTFRNAESVIQFQDKDAGIITGKYTSIGLFVGNKSTGEYITVYSMITVEIKDGKYRVSFSNPTYRRTGNSFGGPNSYPQVYPTETVNTEDIANVVLPDWKNLAANLKEAIIKEKSDF